MSESSEPQYAKVEQPFGLEIPIIHCPICGKATIEIHDECGEVTPCPHLEFIYVGAAGDFEYTSEEFGQKDLDIDEEGIDFDTFKDMLHKASYDNKLLAIEVTYGGMACTPVWYTDVFGFNFGKGEALS
jgi:hypothetical protein